MHAHTGQPMLHISDIPVTRMNFEVAFNYVAVHFMWRYRLSYLIIQVKS